jgi:hypothetical protein
MQLKKLVAAGALSALMAGSSIGFAAGLADYPQPFVSSSGSADFLVVVGSQGTDPAGLASDVAAAVDVAASLGSRASKATTVGGTSGGVSVTGEGKELSTSNTKLYLYDTLGKSGIRNTLTEDELPQLLVDGQFIDSDAGVTSNYQQFIYLTPGSVANNVFQIRWDKPGAGGTEDPTYKIGEFSTSPVNTTGSKNYLYRLTATFDQGVNGSTAVGESIKLFGKTYTVHSDTSGTMSDATTTKFVLSGGADVVTMKGNEKKEIEISGVKYEVELLGVSATPAASLRVTNLNTGASASKLDIAAGASAKISGLDVYVDSATQLSSTDQTTNLAKIQLGSSKVTIQHGTSVKQGDNNEVVKGTTARLTVSNGKLDAIDLYIGASDTKKDFIEVGGMFEDPMFKTFKIEWPSMTTDLEDAANRDKITFQNSGNDLETVTFTDWRGNEGTVNFGWMASGGTIQSLADASGKIIHVNENATIAEDEYLVVDAGDFGHIYQVTSISLTSDSSSSVQLSDVMSGDSVTVSLGADNQGTKVIDGQSYYFQNRSSTSGTINDRIGVTWGATAAVGVLGGFNTIYPSIETKKGAHIAFINNTAINVTNNTKVQLPTGAVTISYTSGDDQSGDTEVATWTFTAANNEDGTATVVTKVAGFNDTSTANSAIIEVGLSAAGGAKYNISRTGGDNGTAFLVRGVDEGNTTLTHSTVLLVEEKDDAANRHVVYIPLTVDTSGSTNKVDVGTIESSDDNSTISNNFKTQSKTDTNKQSGVSLYGTYAIEDTDGQDTAVLWYPDDQVAANILVTTDEAVISSTTGSSGTSVKESVPITTAVARLDSEVDSAARTNKNLILVGGPVVNSLVAEIAANTKTWNTAKYREEGEGTYLIDYVDGAFTTGKAALIVAGHSAADTRAAAMKLVNPSGLTGTRIAMKNGVVLDTSA